ncbi:hypothetical protein BKA69DRAFT_1163336 [Paraphysoderma sedebokerense]|nr:hypothetical protein BKA69DRAFT_1163336 [Paraphysoderma sedebokerense]
MKLTSAIATKGLSQPPDQVKELNLSNQQFTSIGELPSLTDLRKLNLSNNKLKAGLEELKYCKLLSVLNISGNQFMSLQGVENLTRLQVLNVGRNKVQRISHHFLSLRNLKALILNDNQIKRIENLGQCLELNTLVLSHNRLTEISNLSKCAKLTKLSITHNLINAIPAFLDNPCLKELRLNDNKISNVLEHIQTSKGLEILDLGNNAITSLSDVQNLSLLPKLHNLNLKGNLICNIDDYKQLILKLIPTLRVLDNERFDPKFIQRKEKRAIVQRIKNEELSKRKLDSTDEKTKAEKAPKLRKISHCNTTKEVQRVETKRNYLAQDHLKAPQNKDSPAETASLQSKNETTKGKSSGVVAIREAKIKKGHTQKIVEVGFDPSSVVEPDMNDVISSWD